MKPEPKKIRGVFERPAGSGIWYVQYFDEHGRRHREKVGAKSLAIKVRDRRKAEIAERRFFPERHRRRAPLLSVAIDDFLKRRTKAPSADYRRYRKLWVKLLGDVPITAIHRADVERAISSRRGKLRDSSINRELTFLRAVFNKAIDDDLVSANPVRKALFVREDILSRTRHLLPTEEDTLREQLDEKDWQIVEVALGTGIRAGGVFRLRWDRIDFGNDVVTAPAAKGGATYHVPLSRPLRRLLGALPSRGTSPWVFPNTRGTGPIHLRNWTRRVFRPALERAGIQDFHFHDLRHTFATRLGQCGASLREIQELLGHTSPTMTQRYAHVVDAYRRRAVERAARRRAPRGATKSKKRPATQAERSKTQATRAVSS